MKKAVAIQSRSLYWMQGMKKKFTHGGRRPGSGRKSLGRIKRDVSFAPATFKELKRRAAALNVPVGHVIDALLAPERRTT